MVATGNVGLAFGLVIGAGLCTAVGACFALFTKLTDYRMLSGSLGVSAGVMIYISIVEIFVTKSVGGFVEAGYPDAEGYRYATLCFFGGMILTCGLEWLASKIIKLQICGVRKKAKKQRVDPEVGSAPQPPTPLPAAQADVADSVSLDVSSDTSGSDTPGCCAETPPVEIPQDEDTNIRTVLENDDHVHLARMGLLSALAVGVHNFPEGLATFVGALANKNAGIAIAVAIALHNIPEGIVVAMPIYYATGSRSKAFLWALLSGLSEPIGGLIGFFVLYGNNNTPLTHAILFGLVAGIMVFISIKELLPTALRYDPEDKYVTTGCFCGMAVMAASLLLFQI